MLRLASASLAVDLLDPSDPRDAIHLGARFCHGGFIWQVHALSSASDAVPLLSGPEYPSPSPDPFNAQGLPESFRHRTRAGTPLTWNTAADSGIAVGAGTLALDAAGQPILTERCAWHVSLSASSATFSTHDDAAGFAYALTREITVAADTVISASRLTNVSPQPLTLEWFAHPFWPLTTGRARISLPVGSTLPANPGFTVAADGTLTFQRPFLSPEDSQFSLLSLPPAQPLALALDHSALARVTFSTDFIPSECPVWANAHTVSVEPYLALTLAPGETRAWQLRHRFEK